MMSVPMIRTLRPLEYVDITFPSGAVAEVADVVSYDLNRQARVKRQAIAARFEGDVPSRNGVPRFVSFEDFEPL